MTPEDHGQGPFKQSAEDMAKHLSFFVPAGYSLTKTSEIERLQNEAEAWKVKAEGRTPDGTCPLCGAQP